VTSDIQDASSCGPWGGSVVQSCWIKFCPWFQKCKPWWSPLTPAGSYFWCIPI